LWQEESTVFLLSITVVSVRTYRLAEKNTEEYPRLTLILLVLKVTNSAGETHLLMYGIPGKSEIPKVQKLEADEGLKLTLVVASGDFHHMSMSHWYVIRPVLLYILIFALFFFFNSH
jgi:hypothetical protein